MIFHPFVAVLGDIATNWVAIMRVMTTRRVSDYGRAEYLALSDSSVVFSMPKLWKLKGVYPLFCDFEPLPKHVSSHSFKTSQIGEYNFPSPFEFVLKPLNGCVSNKLHVQLSIHQTLGDDEEVRKARTSTSYRALVTNYFTFVPLQSNRSNR